MEIVLQRGLAADNGAESIAMSNGSEECVSSHDGRRRRTGVRIFWYAMSAFIVVVVIVVFDRTIGNQLRCVRAADAILKDIDSLVLRPPTDVAQEQWDVAVYWTHNLHCNSLLAFQSSLGEIRRFRDELATRVRSDVDMSTVDWIWERYAVLTRSGRDYQKYRSVMRKDMSIIREDVKRADPNGDYKSFRLIVESQQRQ